jgi:hypothetical protein
MSKFQTLENMGITSLDDVTKYSVRHESDIDVLKVYYTRPKGSLLPRSKKFTFVRGKKAIPIEKRGTSGWENVQDVAPQLALAVKELEAIVRTNESKTPAIMAEDIIENLTHLEKVIAAKLEEIRNQVDQLQSRGSR